MKIIPCGSVATIVPPDAYFTGRVLQTPVVETEAPARVRAVMVSFEPAARTAWHTHPLGQTLYVTSGAGLVQSWDGPIREIRAGDAVFFAAGEKHWHGAGPKTAMTHLAIQESLDGMQVDWLEKVSEEQYAGVARSRSRRTLSAGQRCFGQARLSP
jgi:quercetin dioxygenase-like cupin family protein